MTTDPRSSIRNDIEAILAVDDDRKRSGKRMLLALRGADILNEIVALLGDEAEAVRAEAMRVLERLALARVPEAQDIIIDTAVQLVQNDTSGETRAAALSALALAEPPQKIKPTDEVDTSAYDGIMAVVTNALENDSDDRVRLQAAKVLVNKRIEAAKPILERIMLNESNQDVRAAATTALANMDLQLTLDQGQSIVPVFAHALTIPDLPIKSAIIALGELKATDTVPALINVLQNDNFKFARTEAALALGKIGGDDAFSTLVETLRDDDPEVRRAVLEALAMLKNPAATEPITTMNKSESNQMVRGAVAWTLAVLNFTGNYKIYARALRSKNVITRRHTVAGLRLLGTPEAAEVLMVALGDSNSIVRSEAIDGLTTLKSDRLTATLVDQVALGKLPYDIVAYAMVEYMEIEDAVERLDKAIEEVTSRTIKRRILKSRDSYLEQRDMRPMPSD